MSKKPVVLKKGQKTLPKAVSNALKGVLGPRKKEKKQKRTKWEDTPQYDDLDTALRDTGWSNEGGMDVNDGMQW